MLNTALKRISAFMRDAELDANDSFYLEMNSSGELSVKGCRDINAFSDTGVMIVSDDFFIDVKGTSLQVKEFSPEITVIAGIISDIGFMKR